MTTNVKSNAYFVGAGVASLAGAAFLLRDANYEGENIHIFEELNLTGGALDGIGNPEEGYVLRGGRMLNDPVYECMWELLKTIPSLNDPNKSVRDEITEFNKKVISRADARLVDKDKNVLDVTTLGFDNMDRMALAKLTITPEEALGTKRICDWFTPSFLQTKFWYMWATTFAFQPWHSLVELKRYMARFMHEFPRIHTLEGVARTEYNQYDSIILPMLKWLKEKGVQFEVNTRVVDLEFKDSDEEKTVKQILCVKDGKEKTIDIAENDLVFVTNGSMVEGSSLGSMTTVPELGEKGSAFKLWENIAKKQPDFGNPSAFCGNIEESLWESFTITFKDTEYFDNLQKFSNRAIVTFKDSNWLMSIVLPYQPHFMNQPKDVRIMWGYSLFPNKVGNFVNKKMSECTGAEILTEIMGHLKDEDKLPSLLETSICIPCMMPFITSQFMPRLNSDRPQVVPQGSTNLAFIGQYCEIPDDVVFTVEYSVRSAQMAVYSLLKLDRDVVPMNKHLYDVRVLFDSFMTAFR